MGFLGKEIRMSRLLGEDGRLFAVAVDHPIARGVFEGLADIRSTLTKVSAGRPDAITMTKGIAQNCFSPYAGKISLILKTSAFSPYLPTCDTVLADVEEGVRLGADAVSMGLILGGEHQNQQIYNLGRLTKAAESYGMPVVAHIYPKGEYIANEDKTNWKNLLYCVRTGAEMGVDIIKTTYSGDPESFAKVVEGCPTRVVVAGGDNFSDVKAFFRQTKELIDAGAAGVTYGRGIWESKNPAKMAAAIRHIVHENGSPEEAYEIFES